MSDYEVTPSAVVNTAEQLKDQGVRIADLGHKAFDLITNLGTERHWGGKQYNLVIEKLNTFNDEMNQLFRTVFLIPQNLGQAANTYATANNDTVRSVITETPQLLETIVPPATVSADTIIYHQDQVESAINQFTATVQQLQTAIQEYQNIYTSLVEGNWVGEAMIGWTNTLNNFSTTASELSGTMNNTISTQASEASSALAAAEKTNVSNVSMN